MKAYFLHLKSLLAHMGGQTHKHTILGKPILIKQARAHTASGLKTIPVNSMLIPSETGMRQHEFARVVVIKFCHLTLPVTAISWLPA